METSKLLLSIALCSLNIIACTTSSTGTPPPTNEVVVADPLPTITPTIDPSPTPEPPISPTENAAAIPTEMQPLVTRKTGDLAVYRQAMRAEFAGDVDMVAQAGASRYYLDINLNPAGLDNEDGLILNGLERVQYTNTEDVALSEIYFRLYPNLPAYNGLMEIGSVVVEGEVVEPELEAEDTALRVPLAQPLVPGEWIDIGLMFRVLVPAESQFGYNIFGYDDSTVALAGFYPALAVYDDNGWNIQLPPHYGDATYLDSALYEVQLTVPAAMVVAASGSEIDRVFNDDGTQTLGLVSGPIREFYIAMRPDYQVASETLGGVVVNSYYPAHLAEGGQQALRDAANALRIYNQLFGPYPYTEFDIAATPTTAGGIEYAGVVVINQQLYEFPGMFFQQAVAHEVAHQWWYNIVGNDQINEPWLDEALTNYSTVFYWQATAGEETTAQVIEAYFEAPYQKAQDTNQDRAVIGPVADFSERDYGIIVYGKGPLFFRALHQEVGDDVYLDIMQTYYERYKYQVARADDLLAIIEQVSGRDIEPLFEQWLNGTGTE